MTSTAPAPTTPLTWIAAKDLFAAALDNFEVRTQQDNLAQFIERTLAAANVGMAQAGCGTGKSFAALISAIAHALVTGQPSGLATATKALQTQYAEKDLPFVQRVLAEAGIVFTWTVLKGRSNYLCLQKLAEGPEVGYTGSLREELDANAEHTGDLDDFVTAIDPRDRGKLGATSDECPGWRECPFGDVCYAEKARRRAEEAEVIVINHAVLAMDLLIRRNSDGFVSLMPELGAVIVDEGHELESYVTSALGSEITQRKLMNLGSDVASFVKNPDAAKPLAATVQVLFTQLNRLLPRAARGGTEKTVEITDDNRLALKDPWVDVVDQIEALKNVVKGRDTYGDDRGAQQKKRLQKRIGRTIETMLDVLLTTSDELVRWLEVDPKRGTILKYAPLHVGQFLAENLWVHPERKDRDGRVIAPSRPRAAVLMSATLAVGRDFSFLAGRLGIDEYLGFDAGSPFNFGKQLRVLVPGVSELADPSKDEQLWRVQVAVALEKLIKAAGGRSLLLFTSTRGMNLAYDALADKLDDLGITVLKQGDATVRELADRFAKDETSVLFGLKSLMTGVDFQGDTLRLTVLDKLPFAVPSDVLVKARCEAIDRYARNKWVDGSFPTYTVPEMALTTIQAAGRQIRTQDDEGMFVLLDPRLHSKKYGRTILSALPAGIRLDSIADGVEYLEELTARRG